MSVVPDFIQHLADGVGDLAHAARLPLLIDSTFSTPWLNRPIEHGADIIIHSATKWIGGHGTAIGGIIGTGIRLDPAQGHSAETRMLRHHSSLSGAVLLASR